MCSVTGCTGRHFGRGYCRVHYERFKRTGATGLIRDASRGCSVDGCDLPHKARGLCQNHYWLFTKHGDPLGGPGKGSKAVDPIARFWSKVQLSEDCWNWLGGISDVGYGNFWYQGTTVSAHRFAYQLCVGAVPEGLALDHLCRNTACVRPDHLEAVTNRVNILRGISPSADNSRKSHCGNGHAFANHGVMLRGRRYCSVCQPYLAKHRA